jgi:hypothetical protein
MHMQCVPCSSAAAATSTAFAAQREKKAVSSTLTNISPTSPQPTVHKLAIAMHARVLLAALPRKAIWCICMTQQFLPIQPDCNALDHVLQFI